MVAKSWNRVGVRGWGVLWVGWECSGTAWGWLHNTVGVLGATEPYTLKWLKW